MGCYGLHFSWFLHFMINSDYGITLLLHVKIVYVLVLGKGATLHA